MSPEFNLTKISLSPENRALVHLINSIPSLVASVDCNMVIQYANDPFKKWFPAFDHPSNFSLPLVLGNNIFAQVQRHLGKVLVGEPANFQISFKNGEGIYFMDVNLTPEIDEHKKVSGFIFHGNDVTDKLNSQRELSDYFENASIGLHWVNAEGIIIWANQAELDMLGYQAEEYIGHHISKFHVNKERIQDILLRLTEKEILNNYETELLCKNGSHRSVSINSSVLWADDKFIHTRCFTIDITEQKLATKAKSESEEHFKIMANLVPLVIWTTDEKGNFNFLNVKFTEITGRNMEQGLGDGWLQMVHPDDKEKVHNSWMSSFKEQKPFEAKFRYLSSTGSYAISYVNASPRRDASENFVGYTGIFQDISSQEEIKSTLEKIVLERTENLRLRNAELKSTENLLKEKNEELERINKELSSFAHVASHDLQEPLRKIQTFSNRLALEGDKLSSKAKDYLTRIQSSSEKMRALINDLLEYSKAADIGGKVELTDLNLILKEVINELELKIEEKDASIDNLGLPVLNVVKFQFRQLFLNLLSNALKFSQADRAPHIVIKSEIISCESIPIAHNLGNKCHHLMIADNGVGFEQEFSSKIFEIFHRLHGNMNVEGTGIGLSICKKIVESHNGIMLADGKVGGGATFHIYLPA